MTPQYFAGLFEGEGNARIARNDRTGKQRNGRKYFYRMAAPVVQLAMTDPEPVYALQATFGGSVCTTRKTSKYKTIYHWAVNYRKALAVAVALLPHTISVRKRAQLELIIA